MKTATGEIRVPPATVVALMKRCTKCLRTLPKSEFHKNPRTADGRAYRCRACANEACRESHARRIIGSPTAAQERARSAIAGRVKRLDALVAGSCTCGCAKPGHRNGKGPCLSCGAAKCPSFFEAGL